MSISRDVLVVQGDPSGTPIPVTGTATNASVGATGSAPPASATYVASNLSGVLTGLISTTKGLKVDGSAATQPVSGTFWQTTQPISVASLPLPTGAAQDSTLTGGTQVTKIVNGANTLAIDGSGKIGVTGTFWQTTQPISAVSLPLPTGAALDATLTGGSQKTLIVNGANTLAIDGSGKIGVTGTLTNNNAAPAATNIGVLPSLANAAAPTFTEGDQVLQSCDLNGNTRVKPVTASTSNVTQVASSASNVTLKVANAARLGLFIYNDSTAILYVKLGTTASNVSYTVQVPSQGYYEIPALYTGRVDGVWSSANGNAYVTEVSI